MRIRAGYRIAYDCPAETPMLLLLSVRPERMADLESPDTIETAPDAGLRMHTDTFGNRVARVLAKPGLTTFTSDFVIRDSGEPDAWLPGAKLAPIAELPNEVLQYLLPSRYCETERLSDLAWSLFGATEPGWRRVQAIVDYAHRRIQFGYHHARNTKTAFEAHEEQAGVCRDFAHLAVALCRCMNVPARYCTGYLGDIGGPVSDAPMDFSAWFEVWLDGAWRTFDARHNQRRVGRVLIAVGRDAADVAMITNFGLATLAGFEVITEELVDARPLLRAAS